MKHWNGIHFTEWKCNDWSMKPEGKVVDVSVNHSTGLIEGGSPFNCHTWMDKMGSSEQFGNRGIPSTPRNGADIEINLCCLYFLKTMCKFKQQNQFNLPEECSIEQWSQNLETEIKTHFRATTSDGRKYLRDTNLSYELRPNYLIGLSYFDASFVKQFRDEIETAMLVLTERDSIGMKTLAPFDPRYHSWYNNNDASSYETANGFSYHNGPEWVHCMGRALECCAKAGLYDLYEQRMRNIRLFIQKGNYINGNVKSLPELTQGNGEPCWDSCNSQNWAVADVLEAMWAYECVKANSSD